MIYASVNLNIGDYESTCDKKIVLYRGDKNVEIRFVMIGNRFTVLESTYAQLIIKRPSATSLFSEPAPIQNETVILTVSEDMIDELKEIGEYTFQIRLYDNEMIARATLPPCEGCLIIERPIAIEAESAVNYATINDSAVMVAENSVEEDIFIDDEYNRTIWVDGDLITDVKMNKLEEALYRINEKHTNDMSLILNIIDEPPIYTKPTITISLSKQNVEHDVETSIAITPTFRQNDAGDVTSYSLFKDDNEIYTNTSVSSYTDTIYLSHGGVITYKAVVSYSDGVIKNTLLGIAYPETSIKAGDISANAAVRGYALSYYGVIDGNNIDNTNGLTSVLRTTKSSTLTFNMVNQRVVYMYPKTFGTLSSIKDANNFDYINSYTLSSITINDVDYYVYILTDAVTITNFKQIFN